jgi:phospholipase C
MRQTGVRETDISAWRRKTFDDLTSAFRFEEVITVPPKLPDTALLLAQAKPSELLPKPVVSTAVLTHESGSRKRTPPVVYKRKFGWPKRPLFLAA